MDGINIQDRDTFNSFQTIIEDIVNDSRKKDFLSRGYMLNEKYNRTIESNVFMEGKVVDFILVCACV